MSITWKLHIIAVHPYISIQAESDTFVRFGIVMLCVERYDDCYQIYDCDGTYKLIKNRFPLIVFGRSEENIEPAPKKGRGRVHR